MEKLIKEQIDYLVKYSKKWIIAYGIIAILFVGGFIYSYIALPSMWILFASILAVILICLCVLSILVLRFINTIKKKDENFIKLYSDDLPKFVVGNYFIQRKIIASQNKVKVSKETEDNRYSKDLFGLLKESNNNDESLRKGKIEKEEYEERDTKLNKAIKDRKKSLEDEKSNLNVKYLRGLITKDELEFELKKIQDELDGFERLKD